MDGQPLSPDRPVLTACQLSRYAGLVRPYTAEQVVSKRGTLPISYPSDVLGKKLWAVLEQRFASGTPSHTYGAYVAGRAAGCL